MKRSKTNILLVSYFLLFPLAAVLTASGARALPAQVDSISSRKISLTVGGNTVKIPYYRNKKLSDSHPGVKRAVVMVHGTNRNADWYYWDVLKAAADDAAVTASTILIAPQFLCAEDTSHADYTGEVLFWQWNNDWKQGDRSDAAPPGRLSSFAVMDTILYRLAARNEDLDTIVVAGHSAGAQYVNRYAVGSGIHETLATYGIHLRHVVANPSSYVYMDTLRADAGTMDTWITPPDTCSDYNDYKYGLNNINATETAYLASQSRSGLRQQFSEKWVVYLLGEADTLVTESLDQECGAWLQGRNRYNRGEIYYNHIRNHYGSWIQCLHTKIGVPGTGHNADDMFRHVRGRFALFDKGHATPEDCWCMWADFNYSGTEDGSFRRPYDLFGDALTNVPTGGTIMMKGGLTIETPTVSKRVSIRSWKTRATVGQ